MNILGVKIDEVSKAQALSKAKGFLLSNNSHKIFTPNPEMLVDAQKDEAFKKILNSADLNLCDGFGLWLVATLSFRPKRSGAEESLSKSRISRISGVDFMVQLCELAEKENKSIYLLGSGSDQVVKKTAEVLQEKFPYLKIVGRNRGPEIDLLGASKLEENENLLYDIIISAPDILFVAFGHGKQEKWIDKNLPDLPSVKIAMGVGGSFDFISGYVKRAPKVMRMIGLEWLWKLTLQPKRIKRIYKATVIFTYIFLRKKFL
jgi:N-acetylglucosaminyldiphosphoundecaprenol N-acetyl-beta-D-mannosaminyltransferase